MMDLMRTVASILNALAENGKAGSDRIQRDKTAMDRNDKIKTFIRHLRYRCLQ